MVPPSNGLMLVVIAGIGIAIVPTIVVDVDDVGCGKEGIVGTEFLGIKQYSLTIFSLLLLL